VMAQARQRRLMPLLAMHVVAGVLHHGLVEYRLVVAAKAVTVRPRDQFRPLRAWPAFKRHIRKATLAASVVLQMRAVGEYNHARTAVVRAWMRKALVPRFLVKVKLAWKRERAMELVKTFLMTREVTGVELKRGVSTYLALMKSLVRRVRAALVLRAHIRDHVIYPVWWELETTMLASHMSLPAHQLNALLADHDRRFDPAQAQSRMDGLVGARRARGTLRDFKALRKDLFALGRKMAQANKDHRGGKHRVAFADGKRAQVSHIIDQYRVPWIVREKCIRKLLAQNVDRWWKRFQAWKVARANWAAKAAEWRLAAAALGYRNRSSWPPVPVAPEMAAELSAVNVEDMRKLIAAKIRQHCSPKFKH